MLSVSDPSAVRFNLSTTQTQPHAWGLQQFHQHGKVFRDVLRVLLPSPIPSNSRRFLRCLTRRCETSRASWLWLVCFIRRESYFTHTWNPVGPESVYEGSSIHPSDARNIPGKQQSARSFLFRERSNLWKTFIYSYYIYIYDGLYRLNYAFSVCR